MGRKAKEVTVNLKEGEKIEDQAISKYGTDGGGKTKLVSVRPQTRRLRHRKLAFLLALKKSLGNISQAATLTGIDRDSHYRWLKDDPEYALESEKVEDIFLDFVEQKAVMRIQNGSDSMIKFILRTKGKKRGYKESLQIDPLPGHILNKEALEKLTDEELRVLAAIQRKCGAGPEKPD